MNLIREPRNVGFLRRLARVYREKRKRVPVKQYTGPGQTEFGPVFEKMPRRAAWQIAWRQARNARGL